MIKRIMSASLALLLTTSTVFATGVPVGCSDGTRDEPVPPTIIPGYTEDVPTRTVKWLVDITGPWWDPKPVYDYSTSDGSCPSF